MILLRSYGASKDSSCEALAKQGPLRINTGMSTVDDPASLQDESELAWFIDLMHTLDVRSYLEIGVRYGGTFEAVCRSLPLEKAVALDFPGAKFGDQRSLEYLLPALARIRSTGLDAHLILGPSQATEVINWARDLGPYDAVFIDGNHEYDAVRQDFINYWRMANKIVALHDIAAPKGTTDKRGNRIEVARYWTQLRERERTTEFVSPGSLTGIGVVYKSRT